MRIACLLMLYCICSVSHGQVQRQNVKIWSEKKADGYILYASNNAYCPMTMSLNLSLVNLSFKKGQQKLLVIPARVEKFQLGELDFTNKTGPFNYSYQYTVSYGDGTLKSYDKYYQYDLPYQKGKAFKVGQGYNGKYTHQNENAIDFNLPEGTAVLAARDGVVIEVVQENNQSCPMEECKRLNNYIIIYHSDGTFANYGHIKYMGSNVKVGDYIKKGELIAYSGNTGWTSGPHLHFGCYFPDLEKEHTIKTKFKLKNGNEANFLNENETYLRNY